MPSPDIAMSQRAIILAAGKGARLNASQPEIPKCLVQLGGITLIERQIAVLNACGIRDVTVVVGCQAERVRRACGGDIHFVENARFAQTNSLYSLWLARSVLSGGFLVMNCDVLFHPQLLADLLTCRHDDALIVSPRGDGATYGAEEMKVRVRRGLIVDISKEMDPAEADGENVGIGRFSAAGADLLIGEMDRLIAGGRLREWAPRAFQAFAVARPLHAVSTRGFPWIEIDFPEDYRCAASDILPLIDGAPLRDRRRGERRVRMGAVMPPATHATVH
jgi:choline kinase